MTRQQFTEFLNQYRDLPIRLMLPDGRYTSGFRVCEREVDGKLWLVLTPATCREVRPGVWETVWAEPGLYRVEVRETCTAGCVYEANQ